MKFFKADYSDILNLRAIYLNTTYESQELFLEMMVRTAEYYIIDNNGQAGYFIKSEDNILLEYFVISGIMPQCETILDQIIVEYKINKIYCKSFDSILLKCCMQLQCRSRSIGFLFRDFIGAEVIIDNKVNIRPAEDIDFDVINSIKAGFFDSEEEIEYVIKNKSMFIYSLNENLIGCGIFQKITNFGNYYDIGMLVNPDFRKKGYGTMIIRHLKYYCNKNGWIPVCGCDINNVASKKTLEAAGFITKHVLIEFLINEKGI